MSVDFDKFLDWAERRFGDVIVRGDEIKLNSIFCEDYKHHLWCNPYGGKKGRDHGVYRCWKTDRRGSLVGLVMEVDKCTYADALDILDAANITLFELEQQVEELMQQQYKAPKEPIKKTVEFPPETFLISSLPSGDYFRETAELYMQSRKLSSAGMYVCCASGSDYLNRLIIPYLDNQGNLIYWNGRYLGKSDYLARYLGPENCGVGKSDVIYGTSFPSAGSKVYLTEGEFDAQSLAVSSLAGFALGGKEIYEAQLKFIRDYKIVICFDTDKYGGRALVKTSEFLKNQGFRYVSYVRPPCQFKDWNEMLIAHTPEIIQAYVSNQEKEYDPMNFI